ncbi:hypothetical protein [Nitrosopumilus sp.]|uniref:hypothetical protein n=1 Tax=Nitrosopumilus sp. TaxID=2024843 RepID=UPI00292E9B34|nr:hypothetical protein [Nitrosopumilus sp.]
MISKALIALTIALSVVSVGTVKAESDVYDILGYDVSYEIENGEIIAMDLDQSFTSLTVEIVSYDDGFVDISIPRGLLDATFDETDDIFYVSIDGTESDYIEIDSDDSTRILIVPFFINNQEIEILSTEVLSASLHKFRPG